MSSFLALVLFLAVVGGGILLIQRFKHVRARGMVGKTLPPTLVRDLPPRALLFLYSPTCSVCKAQRPMLQRLREHLPVVEVDLSRRQALARTLGVFATPTYLYVERGRIRQAWVGAQSVSTFLKALELEASRS